LKNLRLLGVEERPGPTIDKEIAITSIIDKTRDVLGVRQLVGLRQQPLRNFDGWH
jgi:hypothetical protein